MKRSLLIGAIGLALLGIALGWTFLGEESPRAPGTQQAARPNVAPPPPLPTPGQPTPGQPAPKQGAEPRTPAAPSFDVVRIKPNGDAVFAGRAEPGATVTIMDGDKELGTVTADARGEWVFLPAERLPPGARELSLRAKNSDGTSAGSQSVVVLHVPEAPKPETAVTAAEPKTPQGPVAVVTPREGGGSRVLQMPPPVEPEGSSPVTVEVVDYDDKGHLILSGRGAPGSEIAVYLNNDLIGRAPVDENGRWRLTALRPIDPGSYKLRADQTAQGKVTARVEMPFAYTDIRTQPPPEGVFVVVQPGDSLWRIARFRFGFGTRYTVIYQANRSQIRDPDLIYPGQVFAVPN